MLYSAGEAAKMLNISKDTLRYYENEDLLPPINRNESGHRIYTESDVEWIYLIVCLRNTDMPINKIKQYIFLLKNGGNESIEKRRNILLEHDGFIKQKIETYQKLSQLIEKKLEFYNEALENPETVYCMDYAAEWEHFKSTLRGIEYD